MIGVSPEMRYFGCFVHEINILFQLLKSMFTTTGHSIFMPLSHHAFQMFLVST